MKMRMCTCREEPTEAFVLTDEEREFFRDKPEDFLQWINDKFEHDRSISDAYEEKLNVDKIVEENKRLKKEIGELRNK